MKILKLAALALFCLFASANAMAEVVTEGFESVTLENADTWGRATQLSNGWFVQDGYIATSADAYNYGFWTTAYNGSKSLTAQSGTNNAYVMVPVLMMGDVTFYYRKTSNDSRTAGKVYAYKVTESEGTYTVGTRIFMDESATTSWQQCTSIHLTEPTMIAFKMVRAAIDDVTYTTASLEPHEHSYASEWSSDAEGHWHACTSEVGICDAQKADFAAHDGAVCSICGYEVFGIKVFPWIENFNDLTSGIPANWDNSEGTTTTASYKWNSYSSGHEGKGLRFNSYNNKDGITNVLATPYIFVPSIGTYELDFWCKNPAGGDFSVKVAEYGSNEKEDLTTALTNINAWEEHKVSLTAYAGKIVKIYFCGTSNWGTGDAYIYLDDVTVKETVLHIHDYDDAWSHDYTSHWHACQSEAGDCDAPQADLDAHTLDADGVCTVCGYDQPYMEDFEDGIPASWTNSGWTIASAPTYGNDTKMVYSGYQNGKTLVSPRLQASAGDVIDIEALQKYTDDPLTLEYSLDDGETWAQGFSEVPAADNTLHTLHFTAPADGIYLLRFSGRYNYIDNICGFKLAQIPVMAVTTTAGATREGDVFTDDFGRLSANASHTYTVANTGAGVLTVNIASDDASFAVSEATLEVGAGESKTFDLTFVHSSSYGSKAASVTITPANAGLAAVTINASALSLDPEAFFVDFEEGIPATMSNAGWVVQTQSGSKMAYSQTYDTSVLTTPLLVAEEGDEMTFDAYQKWNDEPLKLEYSLDFGRTWVTAFEEAPAENNTARQFTFTAPADGKYLVRFSGSYNYIDNIYGFKLAAVSELTLIAEDEGTYYATFSSSEDVVFAPSVTVNAVTVADGELVLTEVENGFVPANTGVLITASATAARYAVMSATSEIPTDNMLVAASVAMSGENYFYKLAYDDFSAKTGLGFYWGAADGGTFEAKVGGAYLAVPKAGASTKGFRFDGGDVTGIEAAASEKTADVIYNLQGQRIAAPQTGLFVKNGKVVLR